MDTYRKHINSELMDMIVGGAIRRCSLGCMTKRWWWPIYIHMCTCLLGRLIFVFVLFIPVLCRTSLFIWWKLMPQCEDLCFLYFGQKLKIKVWWQIEYQLVSHIRGSTSVFPKAEEPILQETGIIRAKTEIGSSPTTNTAHLCVCMK